MENIKKELFNLLKTIQGNGSFETSGTEKFISPGLRIHGVGEISFPISPVQIAEMINVSRKAPFGKGSKTIVDAAVRSSWEIDSDQLSFHNEDWYPFAEKITEKTKIGLGIESNQVTASLYKLLIYQTGDFFLSHKDSEKEPGMFGTLIIGLPATHTGGELLVRFGRKEKSFDFSFPSSNYKMPYIAFFADCEHEIKPITSGYRVALVYNLVQIPGSAKLGQSYLSTMVDQMATIIQSLPFSKSPKPKAILLDHQYTPANFSFESLKQNDRPRAELLLEASKKAGWFATLGLVTHYKMGELEGVDFDFGNYYRDSSDENMSDGNMGEVIEEYTTIEHWSKGEFPSLGSIGMEEEDMISDFEIGEDEPIEEEEEGYTGNAGMTMEYWYHYGAVIVWPKAIHPDFLASVSVDVRLEWLEYYFCNWEVDHGNAFEMSKFIIARFTLAELTQRYISEKDFTVIAEILIKFKDAVFLKEKGEPILTTAFINITVAGWIKLLQNYTPVFFIPLFESEANSDIKRFHHVLEILKSISDTETSAISDFKKYMVDHIPNYLATISLSKLKDSDNSITEEKITGKNTPLTVLENLFELSTMKESDSDWMNKTTEGITKSLPRTFVNKVLVVAIKNKPGILPAKIKQVCIEDLLGRTFTKPVPPPDWKRKVPDTKNNAEVWNLLRPFLESAAETVYDYKKGEAFRNQMQAVIHHAAIDLKTETIKKGSPYILRITKTQASYKLALKNWEEDKRILETLN